MHWSSSSTSFLYLFSHLFIFSSSQFLPTAYHIIYVLLLGVLIRDVLNQAGNRDTLQLTITVTPFYFGIFP